jgi:hypothetical protein
VFFEYWPSAYPARRQETLHRDVQGGVTGPFGQFTPQLALDTEYSFRLCGAEAGGAAVCAQTRTFRMPTPAGDVVVGDVPSVEDFRPMHVRAESSPSGASPTGTLSILGRFVGTVTSMQVVGNRAAVYAQGRVYFGGNEANGEVCATIADGGPDAPPETGDYVSANLAVTDAGQTALPCTPPSGQTGGGHDGVSVYDAAG